LVRWAAPAGGWHEAAWLRLVTGRPVSGITTPYLSWCCTQWQAAGKEALLLIGDNAPWHVSRQVRAWMRTHHRAVQQRGGGVRMLACYLPIKSPWPNPIEPKWVHGKRRLVEPARLLTADDLRERVSAAFGCAHEPHLAISDNAA